MSWTNVFPVFTEEQIDEFHELATPTEKAQLEEWYGVDRILNPRPEATEIVSVSLFWKPVSADHESYPVPTREILQNAVELGFATRFNPWDHYILPLIEITPQIVDEHPAVSIRVYLAKDLEFLAEDLIAAGNEVYLMKSSSINFAPGGLWRFLPFSEEGKLITVTDIDRLNELDADLHRTQRMAASEVGAWRVPVPNDLTNNHRVCYLPFMGCQFGVQGGLLEVRELLDAFTWHCQRGQIETQAIYPNCGPLPIQQHSWPSYGFDEFFMTIAAYPRLAQDGMLTFVPGDASSILLTMDIEYVTWGSEKSEFIPFQHGSCCGQRPFHEESNSKINEIPQDEIPEVSPLTEIQLHPEPKVAFLFLTRAEHHQTEIWREYLAEAGDQAGVFAHVKERAQLPEDSWIKEHLINEHYETKWGDISLIRATQALINAALQDSSYTHFVVVSESCVPVRPFHELARSFRLDHRSRIWTRSWEEERKAHMLRAQRVENLDGIRKEFAHFQAQWMALNRIDAELLRANDITVKFEQCFAPDECYFATVLSVLGRSPRQAIAHGAITWTDWSEPGSSPEAYLGVSPLIAARIAESGCFFARKFAADSNIGKFGLHRSETSHDFH